MLKVAAAIIEKDGFIFAARKKDGLHLAGYWEFPGGKIEPGETPEECLTRELWEEFGVRCEIGGFLGESIHDYGNKVIKLLGYFATHIDGAFRLSDHDAIRWLLPSELAGFCWAPADVPLVSKLQEKYAAAGTLAFYQKNSGKYIRETLNLDVAEVRQKFIDLLPAGAHILDVGCGSGRDSRVFLDYGFSVTAIDFSPEIAARTSIYLGCDVRIQCVQDVIELELYDAVWACASLLHLPQSQLVATLQSLADSLKKHGVGYLSMKKGDGERWDELGRFFNDQSVDSMRDIFRLLPRVSLLEIYEKTVSVRGWTQCWLNIFFRKNS